MSEFDWQEKFPDMQPVSRAPALWQGHGCGFAMYGARDRDDETNSHVRTHCFTLLFLPILALKAFRVVDAPDGWYFLGRVPLSSLAKAWNVFVLLAAVGVGLSIGYYRHTQTPEYAAGQALAEAELLEARGAYPEAARALGSVARGKTAQAPVAAERLSRMIDHLGSASAAESAAVLREAVAINRVQAIPGLYERALALAETWEPKDAPGALTIVTVAELVAPDRRSYLLVRRRMLEGLVKFNPQDIEYASDLAAVFEAQGDLGKCEALLTGLRDRLGASDGARILGTIYAGQRKFAEACELLEPFVTEKLKKLRAAEQNVQAIQRHIFEELGSQKARGFDYRRYKRQDQAEQKRMVNEYLTTELESNQDLHAAREEITKHLPVVNAVMLLGMIQLQRAQAIAEPRARRAHLEKAEQTFLSIHSQLGETQTYRSHLGQVYYWLGRQKEGRKLFDELLTSSNRSYEALVRVAQSLREVGAVSDARPLVEEAFKNAKDSTERARAAYFRAILSMDNEDRIKWLELTGSEDPEMKASLKAAKATQASRQGKHQEAIAHLREASELYARLKPSPSVLNNGAIVFLSLYHLTGEQDHLDRGVDWLERAFAQQPDDSILLGNVAGSVAEVALRDIIGKAVDFKVLKSGGRLDILSHLYRGQAEKSKLLASVRAHAGMAKAVQYYERLLVQSPRSSQAYDFLNHLFFLTRNTEALRTLASRIAEANLDLTDALTETREFLAGQKDEKHRAELTFSQKRAEESLAAARQAGRKVTLSIAAATVVSHQVRMADLGLAVDCDAVVQLAEEAFAASESAGSAGALAAALLMRAANHLARQEPAFAAMAKQAGRALTSVNLLPLVMQRDPQLRQKILQNRDVQRVLELQISWMQKLPDEVSEWTWALLRFSKPKEAERIAQYLLRDELRRLDQAISEKLHPLDGGVALRAAWALEIAGKPTEAAAVLTQYVNRGGRLPLPVR